MLIISLLMFSPHNKVYFTIEHYDYFKIYPRGKLNQVLKGRVIFRVSTSGANLEIKLSWWFENIRVVRDLPTDSKRNWLCRGPACSVLSAPGNRLPADRGEPVMSMVGFSTLDRAPEAQVCQLGAHQVWVMIRDNLDNGLRVSHISVIILSFGSFEFLIIRHELKYSL